MPTPVNTARQCLTPAASNALDEAVNVARRRGHSQTTSLHAVSALLSLPSSPLRDACSRSHNSAYTPRLQFKALELCLSVSLDRVQASKPNADESACPPVSNSLMAAIKRAQANQRRQPENFHLYQQLQQQQQSSSSFSMSCIKVELKHLILSILDDPVVSRVFGESGFLSSDIKLAIIRPLNQGFRFSSRYKCPPMFLCNLVENQNLVPLSASGLAPGRVGFNIPFSGINDVFSGDENCRRICEVILRDKCRNPMLVGVCAYDALTSFSEIVEKRKERFLPPELLGLGLISIEGDINRFVNENCDKGFIDLRFEEVSKLVEKNPGPGLVVNFGDLKVLVKKRSVDGEGSCGSSNADGEVSYVVEMLTRLLRMHGTRLWLIGATASYETHLKFIGGFQNVEKDWDLQLLPITSLRNSTVNPFPKSSLMEQFVPFGGFFSTPSELNNPLSSLHEGRTFCHMCNQKCEQEISALMKGEFTGPVTDEYQANSPPWRQMADIYMTEGLDTKTRDDGVVLSTKIAALQKKWATICQRLYHAPLLGSNTLSFQPQSIMGFQLIPDNKEKADISSKDSPSSLVKPCLASDLHKNSEKQLQVSLPLACRAVTESALSKQQETDLRSRSSCNPYNLSVGSGSQAFPSSVTYVTTDLGLRIRSDYTSEEPKEPLNYKNRPVPHGVSGSSSENIGTGKENIFNRLAQSSSSLFPQVVERFDPNKFKILFQALSERVGWQDEAIRVICQKIASGRTKNEICQGPSVRGDIWFNFVGPDCLGKKKVAVTLAEVIYGSKESMILADLSPHVNDYDVMFRGQTPVDYVAGELSKKRPSVILLENVDEADPQAQVSLSRAIETGKFPNSHGREVGIENAIFVMTSTYSEDKVNCPKKSSATYSEEAILQTKNRWIQIQMVIVESVDTKLGMTTSKDKGLSMFSNKRKLIDTNEALEQHQTLETVKRAHMSPTKSLDLNLPAEENDMQDDASDMNSDSDAMSESSKAWLQNFLSQADKTVLFKPFDFDALADRLSNEINESFFKIVSSKCSLDMDPKVMEQIIAAAHFSKRDRMVEDWIEQVLSPGFIEVREKLDPDTRYVVKLETGEITSSEEHKPAFNLPTKVNIKTMPLK